MSKFVMKILKEIFYDYDGETFALGIMSALRIAMEICVVASVRVSQAEENIFNIFYQVYM